MNEKICRNCKKHSGEWQFYCRYEAPSRIYYIFYRGNANDPCFILSQNEIKSIPNNKNIKMWIDENIDDSIMKRYCKCYCEQFVEKLKS